MRALPSAAAIIGTLSMLACSRSIAPTAPSRAPSVSTSTSARITTALPDSPPIEPLLAQLNLISNDLDSANHQLLLFLRPNPPSIIPPTPILPQNALNFYGSPNPPPIFQDIISQASLTKALAGNLRTIGG